MTIIERVANQETALTVPQLAQMLTISKRSIYEHIATGRLPCIRIGSTVRLDPATTAAWLSKRAA